MNGQTVSHFEILEELGAGGVGVVYKARDLRLGRFVALKFLRGLARGENRERLAREAKAASALDHPAICTIYELGETERGDFYIAMAYYEGRTLETWINQGPLPVEKAVDVTIQIAEGLARAHSAGILHRDVKPSNVIVTSGGDAKLLDFGLVKVRTASSITREGALLGTPFYMSPEQIHGTDLDGRCDVWSLGVVLYEALTGKRPFTASNLPALFHAVLNDEPRPPSKLRPDLPEPLETTVMKALRKPVGERLAGMEELLAELYPLAPGRLRYRAPATAETAAWDLTPSLEALDNLPTPTSSFVAREHDESGAAELLERADVRLVTLTGPGGTGKTRLSLQVARRLRNAFPDGICFVPLGAVSHPENFGDNVAYALGLKETVGRPLNEKLIQALRNRRLLLVLDNFEQLLDAAPAVAGLLEGCPGIKALVTSRVRLRLRGEHEFPVPPLFTSDLERLPDVAELARTAAVELFLTRAREVRPDFELTAENCRAVAEICVRLGGLPLAIELAAARIRLLSPEAILGRLDRSLSFLTGGPRDAPERHQSLRQAIAWSHDLLSAGQQDLFRRLAVFASGWTLEAASSVIGTVGAGKDDVLDGLTSLLEGSLIHQERGGLRFAMLETIREYARERLSASGELDAVANRHLDYFAAFVDESMAEADPTSQLERLEAERHNLRAALDWSESDPAPTTGGLRLATGLSRFWLVRGYLSEGRERIRRQLGRSSAGEHVDLRARLLEAAAVLAQNQGDLPAAAEDLEEALRLFREMGNDEGVAATLRNLGWIAWRRGDYADARALSEESLERHRRLGDAQGEALCLTNLGWVALIEGHYDDAIARSSESAELRSRQDDGRGVAFCRVLESWALLRRGKVEESRGCLTPVVARLRELKDRQLAAFSTALLAVVAFEQGKAGEARELVGSESLAAFRKIGDRWGVAFALTLFGDVALDAGELRDAQSFYEESLALRLKISDRWGQAASLGRLAALRQEQRRPDDARVLYLQSLDFQRRIGDRYGAAESFAGLAGLAADDGEPAEAARLAAAADALVEALDARLERRFGRILEGARKKVAEALDEDALEAARAAGREAAERLREDLAAPESPLPTAP